MGRHVAVITIACPACGNATEQFHVAEAQSSGLRYSTSTSCNNCTFKVEADGPELTEDARRAFYALEGRWSASLRDLGPRRVESLRVLGMLRNESSATLSRFLRDGEPLLEATLVEVEHIELALRDAGADVLLLRIA